MLTRIFPSRPLAAPDAAWRRFEGRYRATAVASDAAIAGAIGTSVAALAGHAAATALAVGAVAACVLVLVTAASRGYDTRVAAAGRTEFVALLRSVAVIGVVAMVVSFLQLADVPRWPVLEGLALTVVGTTGARAVQRGVVRRRRARGTHLRRALLVGPARSLTQVVCELAQEPAHGFALVGHCPVEPDGVTDPQLPVLGGLGDVPRLVRDLHIESVIVAADSMDAAELRRFSWRLEGEGAELLLAPSLMDVASSRVALRQLSGTPLLSVSVGPTRARRAVKDVMDRVLGVLLLVLAAPAVGVAALAVRLTSPGPAFFRQTRIGRDGIPFTMYKLRTMYTDAEARLAELEGMTDGNGVLFKMHRDPRITPLGRTMRRFSVDELPQLWNVVRGDMSLVGPRPPLPVEVAAYDDLAYHRLHVRPGLTGLWQVSGRSDLTWEQSVRLDLRYVDNWTIGLDAVILWRTVRAVFGGRGAY